jgi:hypothetical protein
LRDKGATFSISPPQELLLVSLLVQNPVAGVANARLGMNLGETELALGESFLNTMFGHPFPIYLSQNLSSDSLKLRDELVLSVCSPIVVRHLEERLYHSIWKY